MASLPPVRAPSRACVQNQITSAPAVIRVRTASGFQREPGAATCANSGAISGEFIAEFLYAAEIEFASAKIRHGFNSAELIGPRLPKRGQVELGELGENFLQRCVVERMQDDETLAFFLVGHGGDHKCLLRRSPKLLQF